MEKKIVKVKMNLWQYIALGGSPDKIPLTDNIEGSFVPFRRVEFIAGCKLILIHDKIGMSYYPPSHLLMYVEMVFSNGRCTLHPNYLRSSGKDSENEVYGKMVLKNVINRALFLIYSSENKNFDSVLSELENILLGISFEDVEPK